jgi:hypothetical protein
MRYVSIVGAVILSLVTLAAAKAGDPSATPTPVQTRKSPFDPIAFLVGGVWRGELPPGPNDTPISIELRAEWLPNQQGIGFNGTYVGDKGRMPYTSGSYFWNAAKQQLVFFYSDNEGGLTEGTVTLEGNALRHDFTITNVHGRIDKARAIITPLGHDAYTNEILLEKNGAWQKVVTVKYERKS